MFSVLPAIQLVAIIFIRKRQKGACNCGEKVAVKACASYKLYNGHWLGEHWLKTEWHSWPLTGGHPFTFYVHSCSCKWNLCLMDYCQCIPEMGDYFCFCVRCAFVLFHISNTLHKTASSVIQKERGIRGTIQYKAYHTCQTKSQVQAISRWRHSKRARVVGKCT